ncbi:hypothetical protein [Brevundimonas sp.]|uniref:hypothetical protein n=1 Tax=Brevundimonas sp. TaxID=1871086 RepID=UPI002B5CF938|nr:hypothetical protein [Brevundimonas sp.]HWQ87040.1 hypothetical protein [Brevundimonas sp.]
MTAEAQANKFQKSIVDVVAKRAAYICSNPSCLAPTSGPSSAEDKAVVIGEGAHIYGAQPGSARFVEEMSSAQRKDISNAIWLCRNCHRLTDRDPHGYPAELLFQWRRAHERDLSEKLGKAAAIQNGVTEARAARFLDVSLLAQQIVIEKSKRWEYFLTLEILRVKFNPILRRWSLLKRNLYTKPSDIVTLENVDIWRKARNNELFRQIGPLTGVMESELVSAWGPLGQPGSEVQILEACELFCDLASQLLQWEEAVRFATLPHDFEEFQQKLAGAAGHILEILVQVPEAIKDVLDNDHTGHRDVTVKFDLPEGWADGVISSYRAGCAASHGLDPSEIDWDD